MRESIRHDGDWAIVFPGLRSRVIFGFGTIAQTFVEIEKLGRARALVLSTSNQKADAEVLA
jgi:maleylacetate reductase